MSKLLKCGHAPGHVRDTACTAFESWADWDGTGPEPTVEYEVHYEPHQILLSRACKLVWNCTDIVPGAVIDQLLDEGLGIKSRTYAACARAIVKDIKVRAAQAEAA
jgi:hypothetical protein